MCASVGCSYPCLAFISIYEAETKINFSSSRLDMLRGVKKQNLDFQRWACLSVAVNKPPHCFHIQKKLEISFTSECKASLFPSLSLSLPPEQTPLSSSVEKGNLKKKPCYRSSDVFIPVCSPVHSLGALIGSPDLVPNLYRALVSFSSFLNVPQQYNLERLSLRDLAPGAALSPFGMENETSPISSGCKEADFSPTSPITASVVLTRTGETIQAAAFWAWAVILSRPSA